MSKRWLHVPGALHRCFAELRPSFRTRYAVFERLAPTHSTLAGNVCLLLAQLKLCYDSSMNYDHAEQIAELLNSQNELVRRYGADLVFKSADDYLYDVSEAGKIIACVELKRVQWYQFEIAHLTVAPAAIRKGFAKGLLRRCEEQAIKQGGRVLQCTIRVGNTPSQTLFEKAGFNQVSQFYYPLSKNDVGVWQKVISFPEGVTRK